MITFAHAISSLRRNTEWVMTANDVENIIWHTPNVEPLTTTEVQAEVVRLEAEAIAKAKADEFKKAAVMAHVKSLGFTNEMIALMYPNLAPATRPA